MSDPFVHLHVASGFSLRHGASPPAALVERALEHEMDTLALTDRDGTYGAVRFAKACLSAGIKPVLGVDLALAPTGLVPGPWARGPARGPGRGGLPEPSRAPSRGGAFRDLRLPRVTFLATDRSGWAAICRLVSATHLAGQRGEPVCSLDLVAEHAAGRGVLALLGPASEVGAAVTARRPDLGRAVLDRWRELLGSTDVVVELVNHRVAGNGPDLGLARRPDGRAGRLDRGRRGAQQHRPLRRPHRRRDRRRPRRRPPAGAARRAPRRPGQRRGVPQVRQGDGRRRRGAVPAGGDGQRRVGGPFPAGPDPGGGRAVRGRPACRPGAGGGALPRARGDRPRRAATGAPTRCCGSAARPASAAATATPRGSGSGSGSTTSCRSSEASASPPTSSPSPTSAAWSATSASARRPGGRAPAAWSTTCSASPASTRCATGSSWSGSSPRGDRRCPTSTSTWSPTGVSRSTTRSSTATAGSAASRSR